jgi:hypothetical protein
MPAVVVGRRRLANTTPRCSRVEDRRTGANTNSL